MLLVVSAVHLVVSIVRTICRSIETSESGVSGCSLGREDFLLLIVTEGGRPDAEEEARGVSTIPSKLSRLSDDTDPRREALALAMC
jgi:hypothetical protein